MQPFEVEALTILLRCFTQPVRALEWGCGSSSLYYYTRLPYGSSWDAVEHDPDWARQVAEQACSFGAYGLTIHCLPPDGPYRHGMEDGGFHNFRQYILYPSSLNSLFDFVLVDGRARVECMAVGWDLLAQDGVMALHDASREEYRAGIPAGCWYLKLAAEAVSGEVEQAAILLMAKQREPLLQLLVQLERMARLGGQIEHNLGEVPSARQRILFVNTCYTGFLNSLYGRLPELAAYPYWRQKRKIIEQCFGDSDFYSAAMRAAGWDADDVIVNCEALQFAWAAEKGLAAGDWAAVLLAQVSEFKPDVVYLQDLSLASKELLQALRPLTTLIAGQIASPLPPQADLDGIDLLFSSFPHFIERFRQQGKAAWYQPLAFEPRVLQHLPHHERQYPVTFVGGVSRHHGKGLEALEAIAQQVPIDVWGYGAASLSPESPLLRQHHGEVWGLEMFGILQQSRITLNRHIDVAEDNANNMRLFEATGCGALLITDYRSNLHELFEIGREVVAYRSPEEAVALIRYYQAHPEEAEVIAKAGQQRTLRDHSYTARMAQTAEILERQLRYRSERGRYPLPRSVSCNYRPLQDQEVTEAMRLAWQAASIPASQRGLVQMELTEMYAGMVRPQFAALTELLRPLVRHGTTVLELGCASGYYYEILEYLLGKQIDYTGVDYSAAMIAMARDYYPRPQFFAADGKSLFFADRQFAVVISSCILLHVPNYREHILETCRVADEWLVVHRTPVSRLSPTRCMAKQAYGVETVELCFNEHELLSEFALHRFYRTAAVEITANPDVDEYCVSYLLRRER